MEKITFGYLVTLDYEIIFIINEIVDDLDGENFVRYMEAFQDPIKKISIFDTSVFKYHVVPIDLYRAYHMVKQLQKLFVQINSFQGYIKYLTIREKI